MDRRPIDDIRNALEELSVSKGGSLFYKAVNTYNNGSPTVYIGLGGLGCKTLQAVRNNIISEYGKIDNVFFLAVDSSTVDLWDLSDFNLNEKFEIYDRTCAKFLVQPPEEAKRWLNPMMKTVTNLKNTGAEGIRQIARLMLCGTNKYSALRSRISAIINTLRRNNYNPIQVNLIAGLSGGTGSGIIIDVAYMIHNIMKHNCINAYDLNGFLFLPDAQKHIPSIQNTPATWASLQRNGYAALKEIDYFMTNGSNNPNKIIYDLETPDIRVTGSKKSSNPVTASLFHRPRPNPTLPTLAR